MKRFLSIFLLAIFIFNMTGYFIVFKVQQYQIRREIKHDIKAGIAKSDLHFFSLSKIEYDAIQWTRPDKEFRKNDEMFDIVHSEITEDSIHLYCVNDKEETNLFANLDILIRKKMAQESSASKKPSGKMFKILKLVYVSDSNDCVSDQHSVLVALNYFKLNTFYSTPFLNVLTPPPRIV